MKKIILGIGLIMLSFVLWNRHQVKKTQNIENYYVESFAMDYVTQKSRNLKNHGELFEFTRHEMQLLGYSPAKIKEIMVKGFDRGNQILKEKQNKEEVS